MGLMMIRSKHCPIAVEQSSGSGLAVLFVHGNSFSKEIFHKQFNSELASTFSCIALDLPGHGKSGNAKFPKKSYTLPGYADCLLETLEELDITSFAVVGWSLGGHIALEMMAKSSRVKAVCLVGTPAYDKSLDDLALAFEGNPLAEIMGQRHLDNEQLGKLVELTLGKNSDTDAYEKHVESAARTDGMARETVFATALDDDCVNQKVLVETSNRPLAIINGELDIIISLEHLHSCNYANLWENKIHLIPDQGHAPFWGAPEQFNNILTRFLSEL